MDFKHHLVSGRVQGVGFRNFVFQQAKRFGICGWTRNLHDGRVEIFAEADEPTLHLFAQAVARGPVSARVESFETLSLRARPNVLYDDQTFSILPDGAEPCSIA